MRQPASHCIIDLRDLNGEYKRKEYGQYSQQDTFSEKPFLLYWYLDWNGAGKVLGNLFKHLFTDEKVGKWGNTKSGWYVGLDNKKARGWLFNPSKLGSSTSDRLPLNGWQEACNGSFVPAPHVTARYGRLEPCKEVRVSSRVKSVKSRGVYLPTGEWSRGRPVYRQVEQPHLYMLVANGRTTWSTRTTPDSTTAWMVSDRSGNSPGEVPFGFRFGWMHSGGNELRDDTAIVENLLKVGWKSDAGIDVTCLCDTHCS